MNEHLVKSQRYLLTKNTWPCVGISASYQKLPQGTRTYKAVNLFSSRLKKEPLPYRIKKKSIIKAHKGREKN